MKKTIPIALTLTALLWMSQSAHASPETAGVDRCLAPYFYVESDDDSTESFPLESTRVEARVNGVVAHVVVEQNYRNEGTSPINARYVFPASTRAAVHAMRMTIGEHVVEARIKEREEAKRTYESAKAEGKSAALLEQHRPNVFGMDVANIMPGDRVKVLLEYTELLVPTDRIYEFVFPTVVGPRYSGQAESEAASGDRWVASPYLEENRPPESRFDIRVALSAGIPVHEVACDTHRTDIRWKEQDIVEISLDDSESLGGDRDFILRYRLAGREISDGMILYEGEDENFFLLTVQPPARAKPEQAPPREYVFVVDVSGSMHGYPLNVSKRLLGKLIGGLRPQDRFNVVLFAGGSRLLSPVSVPGTKENVREAIRIIDDQRGGGGTELRSALEKALSIPFDENFSRSILIVSDGYISAEKEVFELIDRNLNRTNFFAFGIGTSVNRYLMEGIAKCGLGEPFVVTDPDCAEETADRFREYVGAPVLTGIELDFGQFDVYDVEPRSAPDLFADRPLTVFGKYRGRAAGSVEISGKSGAGPFARTIDAQAVSPSSANSALPYLWARSLIARLSDYNPNGESEENRSHITSLGLTYNLLTAYTSFVAVHEEVRNETGEARDVKQPLPLPKGVSRLAVGGTANVPEPDLAELFAIAFAGAILLATIRRRRKGA